ncbi:MAG: isoleucine--tRNA ligase [Candidatus Micrarchaeia archaeon]
MVDVKEIEENILAYWKSHQIYKKIRERNSGGKPFFFCDGPPYATGQIHPGTAWNKCLKDSVLRYFRAKGRNVRDTPGYDTHGLPIEVKVEKELEINNKKQIETLGVGKFITKCKSFASEYIGVISLQFERCGVWMDFEHPYVTYDNHYIDSIWKTIKAADDKKLLTEGVYVVPQCVRCETSLANYELEYKDREDPSLYVKFKVKGKENEYLIIWTTTPWTLVANRAVMVHPTFTYVRVQFGQEVWIVAKERLEEVAKFVPGESFSIIGETSGKKLEGTEYEHPLAQKLSVNFDRKVILSDEHVTLEDGSGLVHTAPGHGPEDFIVCKRYDIEPFCPVGPSGKYTSDAGDYAGLDVLEANKTIISDLKDAGALLHSGKISHRYPYCWRCKTPLIFIATHQWFISITKLKERMLDEIDHSINFHPEFAKTRFRDFVSSAPDWCISRQRYWGTPLPIWLCQKEGCKERKVLGSSKELPTNLDLHRPYIDEIEFDCSCGGKMKRVPDILDVWFDSGNAVWAQMHNENEAAIWREGDSLQADFITEGKDQTRGWFYSLLGSGVVLNNQTPYTNLTMHGFFVDEKGEKMSKSVGNFVPLEDIISKYGADSFRLWGLSATIWDDLKFNYKELDESKRTLDIFLNMGVWMQRFYVHPNREIDEKEYELEDRWLISRTQSVIEKVSASFEKFEPFEGLIALEYLLVEDISRFYLKRLKQRISEGKNVDAGMKVLYDSLLSCVQMLSPYVPFVAEHLYLNVFKPYAQEESVSMLAWPTSKPNGKDVLLETQMEHLRAIMNSAMNARMKANLKLRWPSEELCIATGSTEVNSAVEVASDFLKAMTNTKNIVLGAPSSTFEVSLHSAKIGAKFKADSVAVTALLKQMSPEQIVSSLSQKPFMLDGKYEIDSEMISVTEVASGYAIAPFDGGKVYVKTVIDSSLYAQGVVREITRRVQSMRKELELVNSDFVEISISGDSEIVDIAKADSQKISSAVNASLVSFGTDMPNADLKKDWEIDDKEIFISVRKC